VSKNRGDTLGGGKEKAQERGDGGNPPENENDRKGEEKGRELSHWLFCTAGATPGMDAQRRSSNMRQRTERRSRDRG